MPVKLISAGKVVLFFGFGILCGAMVKAYLNQAPARQLASPSPAKIPHELAKTLAPLKVEIQRPEHLPESNDQEVSLTGRIFISQPLGSDLSYKWILPEGVEVVEGALYDSLSGIKQGQTVELKLVVTGFSREEQKVIALSSTGMQGDAQIGNSAIVVSRPEDTWEAIAPQMQQSANEQLGSDDGKRRR